MPTHMKIRKQLIAATSGTMDSPLNLTRRAPIRGQSFMIHEEFAAGRDAFRGASLMARLPSNSDGASTAL
jgi:hypothetical protein